MRTNEERTQRILERTEGLKRGRCRKKQGWINAAACVICLLLIIGIGEVMPGVMEEISEPQFNYASGVASLVGDHTELGYILMGILSFLLGVTLTILLYRIHQGNIEKVREKEDDEF